MEPHCKKHYLFSRIFYRENAVQYSPGKGEGGYYPIQAGMCVRRQRMWFFWAALGWNTNRVSILAILVWKSENGHRFYKLGLKMNMDFRGQVWKTYRKKMHISIWNRVRVWTAPSRTPPAKIPRSIHLPGSTAYVQESFLAHHPWQKLFENGPLLLLFNCWYNPWGEIANINYIWKLQQCNQKRNCVS